ncbi:MAG: hypothetical protein NT003_05090 [Candidatus Magasanikbacteria bacterium]|nr:hypothetical protein [Candidatus Magasanikbacteria bacterium]
MLDIEKRGLLPLQGSVLDVITEFAYTTLEEKVNDESDVVDCTVLSMRFSGRELIKLSRMLAAMLQPYMVPSEVDTFGDAMENVLLAGLSQYIIIGSAEETERMVSKYGCTTWADFIAPQARVVRPTRKKRQKTGAKREL